MKTITALAVALTCAPLTPLFADEPPQESPASLDTVVVTATRTEQTIDETLASVSVITSADIDRVQARNLRDVLAGLAGITMTSNGGPGKLTSLFMRGTNANHVLVLINGMRFGSITAGFAALQDIPVNQIERIEIVRGPRAALYGSDAIGGVINVITHTPVTGFQFKSEMVTGSFGRHELNLGIGEHFSNSWYRIDVDNTTLDGFDACVNTGTAGCFAIEPDDDGYDNTSISGRFGMTLGNQSEIELDTWQASGETEFDGFFNLAEYTRSAANLHLRTHFGDSLQLSVRGGRSTDDSENFGGGLSSKLDTTRDEFSLQTDYTAQNYLLSLGLDTRSDNVESDTAYTVTERDTRAGFAQLQLELAHWNIDGAVRHAIDDQFGSRSTSSIAVGRNIGKRWNAYVSHGSAFHTPTFNDLYFPGFSNPDLRPEISHSTELGLRRNAGNHRLEFSLFRNKLDDLIIFDSAASMPINVNAAKIHGLETSWTWQQGGWRVASNLTLLNTENQTGVTDGNELPRRADRILHLAIDRTLGDWTFGAGVLAEGRRYDDLGNSIELPGYATVDIRTSWNINNSWELAARIGNLLDKEYQTVAGYFEAERNVQLHLRYHY